MKQILLVVLFMLFTVPAHLISQGSAVSRGDELSFADLFPHQGRPAGFKKPLPSSAAFFTVDPLAFDRLGIQHHPGLRIENFQLTASRRVGLLLRQFEVMSPGASMVAGTLQGDRPLDLPRALFFTGSIPEIPGSFIYLAIFRDHCSGYIELPESGTTRRYAIAPLELADGAPSTMVIYDEAEGLHMAGAGLSDHRDCGSEELEGYHDEVEKIFNARNASAKSSAKNSGRTLQANNLLVAQIAIDCDSAFYVAHGRNLSRASNYALTVMGSISAIYQRDVNVMIQVPYLRVWTGADPYTGTSTGTLLPQVRNYWNANMTTVRRSLVHMFSTSSIGGGIAYLNTLCASVTNGYGYAVTGLSNSVIYPTTAYVWDTDAAAHEIGHNFGSPHTHSCAWSPAIDSCYTSEGGCFSGTKGRVGTIMSYCHLTAFGTQLYLHPRVTELIRGSAETSSCIGPLEGSTPNDVAVASIIVPATGGRIGASTSFTPSAIIKNVGTNSQGALTATITIRDSAGTQVYTNTQPIAALAAGASATVNFASTSIGPIARYSATVSVTLVSDSYQANNAMIRPFEVVASTSGSFTITSMNSAMTLRAGATANITWSRSGAITHARIDFSADGGATWSTVGTNLDPSSGSFSWTVPAVATTAGRVRISDRENASTNDLNDVPFTIVTLPLDWQWARSIGGLKSDEVRAVKADARGNLYVTGIYADSVLLGTTKLTGNGGSDIFVAKYNAGGTLQWAKTFGGPSHDSATGIAIDPGGNVVVTGGFYGSMVVGSTTLTSAGDQDVFVVKYNSDGTVQWAQRGGGNNRDQGRAIAADANGNIIVSGLFMMTGGFGSTNLTSQGQTDAFVVKYNSGGTMQWGQRGGGADMDEANGVAVDGSGNVVMVGRIRLSATFGSTSIVSAGAEDAFVAKYNSGGTLQWATPAGGSSSDEARGVAVDSDGDIMVNGTIMGTVNFGTIFKASSGGRDMYVARYSSSGTPLWIRTGGGVSDDYGMGLDMDDYGNTYSIGHFQGTFAIANHSVASSGGSDVVVAKIAADGSVAWVRRGGGTRSEEAYGIVVNGNGDNAYLAGRYSYTTPSDQPSVFGPESLHGAGGNDAFAAQLAMFRITAPRQGDSWAAGLVKAITWSGFGASQVKIEYSIDNGANWSTIIASAPNNGSHNWTLPLLHLPQVLIRISDADNPAMNGQAVSGSFMVLGAAPPTDLIATPLDGAVDLQWTASPAAGVTGYTIYRGATAQSMTALTTVDASQRTYRDQAVTNCSTYVYGITARIALIESPMSATASARPEAPKTLDLSGLTANESVRAGATKNLSWTSTGCISNVQISYSTDGGAEWNTIIAQTANNGGYAWQVPNIPSARVIVRINDQQNPAIADVSDTFSICNLPASVQVQGVTMLCEGQETILSAPSGYAAYRWSNGATTQTITVSQPGTYSVTVTDVGGCSVASEEVVVQVNAKPQPTVSVVGSTTICQGESVTLRAPDGYVEYQWSTGHTTREITVVGAGSYWVTVTAANGCTGISQTVSITVNPKPQPTITANGPTSFYAGESVTLSAPNGFASYRWSNNATTRQITVTDAGTYTVTVTEAGGCSGVSQPVVVKIIPKTQPTVAAVGPTVLCHGDSVELVAADGYTSYQWSNGATTRKIKVGQSGSYTVTVTDNNGQNGTSDPVNVLVHAAPAKPIIVRKPQSDSLIYSGPNGTVRWEMNGVEVPASSDRLLVAMAQGTYKVTVIDSNGCVAASDPLPITLTQHSGFAIAGERGLMLHPNPSNGRFVVEMDLLRTTPLRLVVIDMSGNEVLRIEEPIVFGGYRREIDITPLPAGAYMIELRAGDVKWGRKVVKQ